MYKIVTVDNLAIDPVYAICPVGSITDDERRYADVCILAEGVPSARAYINSTILKEALLNSPEILERFGLCVKGQDTKPESKELKSMKDLDMEMINDGYATPEEVLGEAVLSDAGEAEVVQVVLKEPKKKTSKKPSKPIPVEGEEDWG